MGLGKVCFTRYLYTCTDLISSVVLSQTSTKLPSFTQTLKDTTSFLVFRSNIEKTIFKANMSSNIRTFAWSSLLSLALAQTATLQFFNQDTVCASGLFAQCTGLPTNDCCFIGGLATCVNWQADNGANGVASWFLANNQNQCGVIIVSAENNVCVCPDGDPIVSAGNWALAGRAISENEDCNPVGPDVFGWKEENGATWLLHQEDNTAVFDQVTEAIAKNSTDQHISDLIKEHGVKN